MSVTITAGWWLLPFFLSMPFIWMAITEWNHPSSGPLSGAFGMLAAMFHLFIPTLIWLIYFAAMYFVTKAGGP